MFLSEEELEITVDDKKRSVELPVNTEQRQSLVNLQEKVTVFIEMIISNLI